MLKQHLKSITIIGLGDMGSALAEALLKNDYQITVWNRSIDKASRLVDLGAKNALTLADAISQSSVSIICVSDHETTINILDSEAVKTALRDRTLIQLSTITSAESRQLAEWLTIQGTSYLDGQILSYPEDVLENRASIVCSGPKTLFEQYKKILSDMSGNLHHVGEQIGAAPTFDKAHLSWAMGNYLVFLQAAAMCSSAGVNLRSWCDFNLQNVARGDYQRELDILSNQVCNENFDEGLDASMDVWLNAINKTVQECKQIGVNPVHLTQLQQLANNAVDTGDGQKELGVLFKQLTMN